MKSKILKSILSFCFLIPCSIAMASCGETNGGDAGELAWSKTYSYQNHFCSDGNKKINASSSLSTMQVLEREFNNNNINLLNILLYSNGEEIGSADASSISDLSFDGFKNIINSQLMMHNYDNKLKVRFSSEEEKQITVSDNTKTKTYSLITGSYGTYNFADYKYGIYAGSATGDIDCDKIVGEVSVALKDKIEDYDANKKEIEISFYNGETEEHYFSQYTASILVVISTNEEVEDFGLAEFRLNYTPLLTLTTD